ncbi:MAG: DUF177 domain-containing protein [Ruminococcus sp.]|nr:DUF177 domain-containing protein [Ruminococcus sp.]
MTIDLRNIFEQVILGYDFEDKLCQSDLPGFPYPLYGPIKLYGHVSTNAGIVTLRLRAEFKAQLVCDRCLAQFEREMSFDFEHTLVRVSDEDYLEEYDNYSDEYIQCPDDKLDVTQLAGEDIMLGMPTKILCGEDCEGISYDSFFESVNYD